MLRRGRIHREWYRELKTFPSTLVARHARGRVGCKSFCKIWISTTGLPAECWLVPPQFFSLFETEFRRWWKLFLWDQQSARREDGRRSRESCVVSWWLYTNIYLYTSWQEYFKKKKYPIEDDRKKEETPDTQLSNGVKYWTTRFVPDSCLTTPSSSSSTNNPLCTFPRRGAKSWAAQSFEFQRNISRRGDYVSPRVQLSASTSPPRSRDRLEDRSILSGE